MSSIDMVAPKRSKTCDGDHVLVVKTGAVMEEIGRYPGDAEGVGQVLSDGLQLPS
jgi:hypothetical protein